PGDDVVPLGALLLFAALVGEFFVGGHGELGDRLSTGRGLDLGIFAQPPDENDFIDHGLLSFEVSPARAAGAPRRLSVWWPHFRRFEREFCDFYRVKNDEMRDPA